MEAVDVSRANSALWTQYLEQQYGFWLAPLGGPAAAALLGTAIAATYGALWGDFIARLFATNAGEVTSFVQSSGAHVRPRWSALPLPPTALDDPPPWLRETLDEIARREEIMAQRNAALAPASGATDPVGAF